MVPVRGRQAPLHAADSGGNGRGFRGAFWQGVAEGADRPGCDCLRGLARCLFLNPATTLSTNIFVSSSLKAGLTEIMNRPIGELSSVLSPWEVASHATP
jgi:hypothetical protein